MGFFSRKPQSQAIPSTGHPGDDQLIGIFAKTATGKDAPRDWVHYVYCDTDEGAASMEEAAVSAGWTVRRLITGEGIRASRADLPVNDTTVPPTRAFFEGLAASVPGGDYDGWEAASN